MKVFNPKQKTNNKKVPYFCKLYFFFFFWNRQKAASCWAPCVTNTPTFFDKRKHPYFYTQKGSSYMCWKNGGMAPHREFGIVQ